MEREKTVLWKIELTSRCSSEHRYIKGGLAKTSAEDTRMERRPRRQNSPNSAPFQSSETRSGKLDLWDLSRQALHIEEWKRGSPGA